MLTPGEGDYHQRPTSSPAIILHALRKAAARQIKLIVQGGPDYAKLSESARFYCILTIWLKAAFEFYYRRRPLPQQSGVDGLGDGRIQ